MRDARVFLSLVVPVLDEEKAIGPFLDRAVPALDEACRLLGPAAAYEIVFVDDGSTDMTVPALIEARRTHPTIEIVSLSRNFGKDAALSAGLRAARGNAVIPIDVDLQDPPEVIPAMVARWIAGAEVVNVLRADRSSDGTVKRATASGFYRLYNMMAERRIAENVGDFRLIDRRVVDVINAMPERTRFMKGLVSWVGFRQDTVEAVREPRAAGRTKWRWWRLWNFALDGFTGSTTAPLRIWTYVGAAVAALAFLYGGFLVSLRLFAGTETPGYTSIMVAVLFLGGLNLVSLGILGEYIGRIAAEVRGRPLYIVRNSTRDLAAPSQSPETTWTAPSTPAWPMSRQATGGSQADAPFSPRSSTGS